MVILCKIQALPLAFVLGVWSVFLLFQFHRTQFFIKTSLVVFVVGAVWGAWLFYLNANGVIDDFSFITLRPMPN
ncbi:MAG: hypothetical protein R2822_23980 [Spirosomataceae bacterium]